MKRSKQFSFSDPRLRKMKAYGGTLRRLKKNRGARPVSARHPLHLVFKSSHAKGDLSFLRPHARKILKLSLDQMSKRYGLRILELGICGNLFHLLVKFQNRPLLISFMRAFTGTLARRLRRVDGRSAPALNSARSETREKFFDFRPFSRVVESFRGYEVARDYVFLNHLEGLGVIPDQKNRTRGRWWRDRRSKAGSSRPKGASPATDKSAEFQNSFPGFR